jgi:NAD(P)-dependent dehydrogenase (short-subunit alcohol dehydrogenase family)
MGVGRTTAERFANEGYTVCALARSKDKLASLAARSPERIFAYPTDVADAASVEASFTRILADHGRIDVLVNNAGVTTDNQPIDAAVIDRVIDTNLKGALYCAYAVLPVMREQGRGHIINVASIAGVDIAAQGNDGLYAASKHGMVAFSESLGKMVRREGVLVTALSPGGIDTPLWTENHPYPLDKEMMIRPEEVADLIAYILAQPKRTLFKNVIFVPVVEEW